MVLLLAYLRINGDTEYNCLDPFVCSLSVSIFPSRCYQLDLIPVLTKLLFLVQTHSFKGRFMTDSVIPLHESLHECKNKKQQRVLFKIYF
jgi:hypothetical protein